MSASIDGLVSASIGGPGLSSTAGHETVALLNIVKVTCHIRSHSNKFNKVTSHHNKLMT